MAVSPDRISEHLSVGSKVIPVIRDGRAANGEQNIADGNPAEQAAVGRPLVWRPLRLYPNGHRTDGEAIKREPSPLQTMRARLAEEIAVSGEKLKDLNANLSITAADKNSAKQLAVAALVDWVKTNDESIRTNPRRSAVKRAKKILIACQKDPAAGVSLPDELKGVLQDYKDSSKQYRREVSQRTYHNRQVRELTVWDAYLADQEGLEFARVHLVNQLRAYQNILEQENLADNHPRRKRLSVSVKILEVSIAELDRKIPGEMSGVKKPFGKMRKNLTDFAKSRRERFSTTNQLSVEDIVAKVTDINKKTLETEVAQVALEEVDDSLEPSQYPLARLLPIVLAVSAGTAGLAAVDASGAFRNEALSATVQFVSPRNTVIARNGVTHIASVSGDARPTVNPTHPTLPTITPTENLVRNGALFTESAATRAAEIETEASATETASIHVSESSTPTATLPATTRPADTATVAAHSPTQVEKVIPTAEKIQVIEATSTVNPAVTKNPATATARPTEAPTRAATAAPIIPSAPPKAAKEPSPTQTNTVVASPTPTARAEILTVKKAPNIAPKVTFTVVVESKPVQITFTPTPQDARMGITEEMIRRLRVKFDGRRYSCMEHLGDTVMAFGDAGPGVVATINAVEAAESECKDGAESYAGSVWRLQIHRGTWAGKAEQMFGMAFDAVLRNTQLAYKLARYIYDIQGMQAWDPCDINPWKAIPRVVNCEFYPDVYLGKNPKRH